jgi:hypothetical protein
MNIQQNRIKIKGKAAITRMNIMQYQVFYKTKWLKSLVFCGEFNTIRSASDHVQYLQNKLPNGMKIVFKITG